MATPRLPPHPSFAGVQGPVLVVVMDGVGYGRRDESDAVWLARTPHLDRLEATCPRTALRAHGLAVGMPSDADMGNSEVGHNTLGAGRVFDQGAKLVREAIASGAIFQRDVWLELTQRVRERRSTLHFIGLLSDGNVHSHIDHLLAMVRRAAAENVERVRVHVLLDGRDVPETSCLGYIETLEALLSQINGVPKRDYRIASGGGRMRITMDRYGAEWGMVERGYRTHVRGEGRLFSSAREAVLTYRDELPGLSDQHIPPFVIADGSGKPNGMIEDGSSVVLFNFRGDRAVEMSLALERAAFTEFDRHGHPDILFAGMMQYDGDLSLPARFLVPPPAIDRTLSEYLVGQGMSQFAISETQKFGHVTYFWNGNRSGKFDDRYETYCEVPSDALPFEERPWMKASEITDLLLSALTGGKYRHLRVNYANGDMVGHTGFCGPARMAVEAVDLQLGRLAPAIERLKGAMIVTADHGNADQMFEVDGEGQLARDARGAPIVKTSHTLNRVPFLVYAPGAKLVIDDSERAPGLARVAASVLHLLGLSAPEDYGPSLLRA